MSVNYLNVNLRENSKENAPKRLRREGKVPGIFYAKSEESIPISIDMLELERLLHKEVTIIDVKFSNGKNRKAILREIQRDPVRDTLIHIDIMGIKLDEVITLDIPIILKGTPVGVREEGGIVNHLLRRVDVKGLPEDIPEHIEVDISELKVGDSITLQDIPEEKFTFELDKDHGVANVIMPKIEEILVEEEEEVLEGEELEEGEEAEEGEEGKEEKPEAGKESESKESKEKSS
ncbi:MAG: 50S ribosomal protein L25 [bacterium]